MFTFSAAYLLVHSGVGSERATREARIESGNEISLHLPADKRYVARVAKVSPVPGRTQLRGNPRSLLLKHSLAFAGRHNSL